MKEFRDHAQRKKRMFYVLSGVMILLSILTVRLLYVMTYKSNEFKELAYNQWTSGVKVEPKRGTIYDRNGKELVVSENVHKVNLDLSILRKELKGKNISEEALAKDLAEILNINYNKVLDEMTKTLPNGKPRGSAILKRRIDEKEQKELRKYIEKYEYAGILISPDTKRYYENGNFLSHVLGHTRSDGVGLTGVELSYDKYLAGVPGRKIEEIDNERSENKPYTISKFTDSIDGKGLVLTIDKNIQEFAEKAANEAMIDNDAKAVSILVTDPKTGEILALVNKPDYDLNDPWISDDFNENQKSWRNRAVNDTFEPGSIFKIITATAALAEGLVDDNDKFSCSGSMQVANRVVHCHKRTGHGEQTFSEIIQNSCNMGFIVLGKRLGAEKLTKYIKLFGLGEKTGVDLSGEAKGIIKKAKDITEIDLATISFGQTNTLSMIQYIQALNVLANGGKLVTPHVMRAIIHKDGDGNVIVDKTFKSKVEQSIDKEIADKMRVYLEKVVEIGGGKKAYIPGYRIGGKTGTAQKVDYQKGGYASGKYVASFGGMAPCDDPIVSIMISIDEPNPALYYAGQIAAPVAKNLFFDVLNYYGIEPDGDKENLEKFLKKDIILPEFRGLDIQDCKKLAKDLNIKLRYEGEGKYINDMTPKPGFTLKEDDEIILYLGDEIQGEMKVIIPDLVGMEGERAKKLLEKLGLEYVVSGEGVVTSTTPKAGMIINKGTKVILNLDRDY
ncbi:stage V sporulation protein D [Oceanirhabdus seepicola]|uniref:Stage V sporulation protein D n=1 Tax=Oceanirhabdus seepicola TaxID=2828781 RepID=A0A9J6PA59_9CLOT|nr:stage V sporulation protein D [Oceanirhabdus seepicola]MCM1992710.1 stage V sporulation protein D [Oceanirhabdus seepicola]